MKRADEICPELHSCETPKSQVFYPLVLGVLVLLLVVSIPVVTAKEKKDSGGKRFVMLLSKLYQDIEIGEELFPYRCSPSHLQFLLLALI